MGWDPNLKYAWSRAGAASTCQIFYDKDKMIENLIAKYGQDELVHDMNGIVFHHLQSKKIADFCNDDRVAEIKAVVAVLEQNNILSPF